jgi:uncharacterized protein YecE (DUF72 family)
VRIRIGTSGWSYPTWRPGFYPPGLPPAEFLGFYAQHFDTVELNTTAYRLPAFEQFERWAAAVPDGFRFAPKLSVRAPGRARAALERIARLGDRLGPVRVVVEAPQNDELVPLIEDAAQGLDLAWDFRHESWADTSPGVAVNDYEAEPFRYIRLREPPYTDDELAELAVKLRAPAYVFLRHEEAPTAPVYAERLRELLTADGRPPG